MISTYRYLNPFTKSSPIFYPSASHSEIQQTIEKSYKAYFQYSNTSIEYRKTNLLTLSSLIEKNLEKLATLISEDMGKPITQAKGEVRKSAFQCKFFAENLESLLHKTILFCPPAKSYIKYEPIGPLYFIMPWNYPIWLPIKAGIPALALGNTIILKPAPNVPRSTFALQELMDLSGFRNGEFQTLLAEESQTEDIIKDSRIAGASVTGSVKTGKIIAKLAGENLKRFCLELGGSDPFIVLEDADLTNVAKMGAIGRLDNAGQVCDAAKRFIILENVYSEFVDKLMNEVMKFNIGDPLDPSVTLGPMAREDIIKTLKNQIKTTIRMGAKVVYGNKAQIEEGFSDNGNFFNPMILENVPLNSPGAREEIFGPTFILFKVKTHEEAIRLANDTNFGLGATIWSQDISKAQSIANQINSGMVAINTMINSDPRLPFGGTKNSGIGKECGISGFKTFALEKTIVINEN